MSERRLDRVLIVHRDSGARDALTTSLKADGMVCEFAHSATHAGRQLERSSCGLVIFDSSESFSILQRVCTEAVGVGVTPLLCGECAPSLMAAAAAWGVRGFLAGPLDNQSVATVASVARSLDAERRRWSAEFEQRLRQLEAEGVSLREQLAATANEGAQATPQPGPDSGEASLGSRVIDGVVYSDATGNVRLINSPAENMLGVRAFSVIGRPLGPDLDGYQELVEPLCEDRDRAVETGAIERTVEVHCSGQDLVYIRAVTTPVRDHQSRVAGVMTTLENVTDAFKIDQLKNQYLSIVAHELRTPLTGIKTFSTMMVKATLGPLNERQQRVMESIREQSLRLEHQIDKLINLGYLDSNDYGKDLEVFDVDEFLAAVVAPFEGPVMDRGITLRVDVPQNRSIRADRADLKRAVQALIENAVKFSPEQSTLDVSAVAADGSVRFAIRDHGIGIDPRYQRRIFEQFFQVEDPLTRHHGGAGLGLYVANRIVRAHGATIEVSSQLGEGAEFSFSLQTHEQAHTTTKTAEPTAV